ncbi:DUF4226 domain-containing protein [Mycobacterium riyadhense]|uniref:DUF4226 domain-containing protein n=1 Tax=Mycobacterium riyadhense TaxID=486698 RepID=UPI00195807F5|nr:DUF4226 domain-containing protein [Mycobacterium riyadhense]
MPSNLPVRRFGRAMGFFDVLDDLLDDLFGIFDGGADDVALPAPQWATPGTLFPSPGAPSWGPPPQPPGGPSGLEGGAGQAGTTYQQAAGAVQYAETKLADLLKQIFAANDDNRARVSGIIASIQTARKALTSNPQTAGDPHAMALFNQFLDGQLAQIQQILDSSKVDSTKQAELLAALGDEYRGTAGEDPKKGKADGAAGGGEGGGDTSGGEAGGGAGGSDGVGDGGGAGATTAGGGAGGGLIDPLAGLGGAGTGDPLSMLGPAMAALGSIPGALGGAAGSLPMDALGALGPLASGLAGQGGGDGFKDGDPAGHAKPDDFDDATHGKGDGDGGKNGLGASGKDDTGDTGDKNGTTQPAGMTAPQPGVQAAPAAAVPASAGGDPSRVVQMPDGSPVTAPTAQHAVAARAVLNGSTVGDAWKQAHVELPPPGTPVTAPADPSHLLPGQIAQFKSRDPVMYVGNGKIWLDGQLQPQSALPTGDFLGWLDPPELADTTPVPTTPGSAAPAGQPGITNTSGS